MSGENLFATCSQRLSPLTALIRHGADRQHDCANISGLFSRNVLSPDRNSDRALRNERPLNFLHSPVRQFQKMSGADKGRRITDNADDLSDSSRVQNFLLRVQLPLHLVDVTGEYQLLMSTITIFHLNSMYIMCASGSVFLGCYRPPVTSDHRVSQSQEQIE